VNGIGAVECFNQVNTLAEVAKGKSLKASNLWFAAREKADAQQKAKEKAQQKAEIKALLKSGDKQIEEAKELIEAMQGLKLEEGSCGGLVFLFLFYFLLARLEGNRCVSVIVLTAMGCLVSSLADAANRGGCSVSKDESVIELFEDSCSQEVLESLIQEIGLVCTEDHRMEGASLSMAAPTDEGLSREADLRHRFLGALCWKGSSHE
jgi:hypothetical protein